MTKYELFEDIEENEDGTTWTSICSECVEDYKNNIDELGRLSNHGSGCCMVKGCHNSEVNGQDIFYLDFK